MTKMTMNRQELQEKNESYQAELKSEVEHAQVEVMKIIRNALIAGGLALTANLLQKAFFRDEEERVSFKAIKYKNDYLTDEVTERATVEALKIASTRLERFLEEVNK